MSNQTSSATQRPSRGTTLDQFISKLLVLQAQGSGQLPVLIETRNRAGAVIYAQANARQDEVLEAPEGLRRVGDSRGSSIRVVRVG